MSVAAVDMNALAQSRVAGALTKSRKFRAYVGVLADVFTEVRDALLTIEGVLDIDNQQGVVLDLIGAIVGQPRRLLGAAPRSFFGFKITSPGDFARPRGFGDRANSTWGGAMWSRGASLAGSALMQDADYKFALKARIKKNNLRLDGVQSWIDQLYDIIYLVIPDHAEFPLFITARGMSITLCFGRKLLGREVALLLQAGILPIPQGRALRATCWDDTEKVLGFRGQTVANISCMGDRAYPTRGGRFAERVRQNVAG